ncbi:ExbD/TolR family protein [Roseivivax marinus]|uniref:ExbD/TolR family protein n=1 Tax=Roseivivax marinus TaxID=1379903 RepID=UPI0027402BD4|nr:biopolymer transporter ExbD [Roseivivax marinus]
MTLGDPPPRRRPSLTPMIDVVFLLLVFFMLSSRFGTDVQVPLNLAGDASGDYSGPPRLVDVRPDDVRLNGSATPLDALPAAIEDLTETPQDTIVLRARDGAALQRVVTVMETLGAAGFDRIVLVEGRS